MRSQQSLEAKNKNDVKIQEPVFVYTQFQTKQQEDTLLYSDSDHSFRLVGCKDEEQVEILLKLMGIFQSALPNIPTNEIYNCLFSSTHQNLVCFYKNVLIGGMSFTCWPGPQKYAQIKLFGIDQSHRMKGNGQLLMNTFKRLMQSLNFSLIVINADNSSLDFYYKQGFSKTQYISNKVWSSPEERYSFITKLQCLVNPEIDYFTVKKQAKLLKQRLSEFFKEQYLDSTKYTRIVQPSKMSAYRRQEGGKIQYFIVNPMSIQGIAKNGWSWAEYKQQIETKQSCSFRTCIPFLSKIYQMAEPELRHISQTKDQSLLIAYRQPIDLIALKKRIFEGVYQAQSQFWADFVQFLDNATYLFRQNQRVLRNLQVLEKEMSKLKSEQK